MNTLILAVLIRICIVPYAIWRTQIESLKVLRQVNVTALNAAQFLRDEPAQAAKPVSDDNTSQPN